jgi:hypothetical protein
VLLVGIGGNLLGRGGRDLGFYGGLWGGHLSSDWCLRSKSGNHMISLQCGQTTPEGCPGGEEGHPRNKTITTSWKKEAKSQSNR